MKRAIHDALSQAHEAGEQYWQEHDFRGLLEHELEQFHAKSDDLKQAGRALRSELNGSEHILTPATLMTISRPLLAAAVVAPKLLRGEQNVLPWVLVTGLTDGEGTVARLTDKYFPESGIGSSKFGAQLDPQADSMAGLIMGAAALRSPNIPWRAKAGIAGILATETHKTVWAVRKNYHSLTETGESFAFHPGKVGKTSTAEKFGAFILAAAAHDTEDTQQRDKFANYSLLMASAGIATGELALRGYKKRFGA